MSWRNVQLPNRFMHGDLTFSHAGIAQPVVGGWTGDGGVAVARGTKTGRCSRR